LKSSKKISNSLKKLLIREVVVENDDVALEYFPKDSKTLNISLTAIRSNDNKISILPEEMRIH
jgi:hypothetical protein